VTRLPNCRECDSRHLCPVPKKTDQMYCQDCGTVYILEPARWRKTGRTHIEGEENE